MGHLLRVWGLLLCAMAVALGKKEGGEGESAVIALTDASFADSVRSGTWVLEFYAPWCGHCKQLAPRYERAARKTSGKGVNGVRFAKVDATANPELAAAFGVTAYPTLHVVRASDGAGLAEMAANAVLYEEGTSVGQLEALGARLGRDVVRTVGSVEEARDWAGDEVGFVACGHVEGFEAAAHRWAHASAFFAAPASPACPPGVVRVESGFGDGAEEFLQASGVEGGAEGGESAGNGENGGEKGAGEVETDLLRWDGVGDLTDWVAGWRLSLLPDLTGDSFQALSSVGRLLAVAAVDPRDAPVTARFLKAARALAMPDAAVSPLGTHRAAFQFAVLNGVEFEAFLKQHGVPDSDTLPIFVVLDPKKRGAYFVDQDSKQSFQATVDFLKHVSMGQEERKGVTFFDEAVLEPIANTLQALGYFGYVLSALIGLSLSLATMILCCGWDSVRLLFSTGPTEEDIQKAIEIGEKAKKQAENGHSSPKTTSSPTSSSSSTRKRPKKARR